MSQPQEAISAYQPSPQGLEEEVAALRRRSQELTDFIENAPIPLHWVGPDGTILWANQTELDALGYTKEEYIGHHIAEFHQDPPVIQSILERLQAGETLRDQPARLRAKDGSLRHVLINSNVLWDEDRFVHTRCITRDVTDRIKSDEDLRKADEAIAALAEEARKRDELFRAALQNSPIVVFHQNAELRYTFVFNPFPEHAAVSLHGKLDTELFPADQAEQLNQIKSGVLASGKGVRKELAITSEAGLRMMDLRIEPYLDSSGRPAGILGTAVDITERKRNEQGLMDSRERLRGLAAHLQVLREKERSLTSHDVHDIGQTLTALDQQLSVLARHMAEGGNKDVMAERLKAVSGMLGSAIESSARISSDLRPSLLDNLGLAVTLHWQAEEFARRTGLRVVFDALEDVRLDTDTGIAAFRIFQTALHSAERHSHADEIHISMREMGRNLVLKISDNGTEAVSEPAGDPGSLDLLAMRELALLRGGTIDIRASSDEGTTVLLQMPIETGTPGHDLN